MLSVGGSGTRSRSKSPGGREARDRSRSRDIRAPSPARRAPSPAVAPVSHGRSREYYDQDDDEDSLVSDSEDRRQGYVRGHERALVKDPRNRYADDDDDDDEDEDELDDRRRRAANYAEPEHLKYAAEEDLRARKYRHDEPRRGASRDKEYTVPGGFDDDEEDDRTQGYGHADKSRRQERPNGQPRHASYTMGQSQYEKLPQFQYAAVDPKEVKYMSNNRPHYTRTPSDSGATYTRNPLAQVTVASNRHNRKPGHDDRNARDTYDKYERDDRQPMSRRDLERLEKERDELRRQEELKRQLDQLRKEKEEREEKELKQKRAKNVQIRDERDKPRRRESDVHDHKSKYGRRTDDVSENEEFDRRRNNRYEDAYNQKASGKVGYRSHDYEQEEETDSDEDEQLDRLYHAKYREEDRADDRFDERKDKKRRDRDERKDKPNHKRIESDDKRHKPQVVEIHPGGGRGSLPAPSSSLGGKSHRLSVSGQAPGALSLAAPNVGGHARRGSFGAPPGSPLLESYRGTYQSISPMPSPMALAHHADDSDLSDFELPSARRKKRRPSEDSDSSEDGNSRRKPTSILKQRADGIALRARQLSYDPELEATALAREMKGSNPSPEVLVQIFPTLSDESISALRTEYKKHAKIQGKGINIAKHIKLKLGNSSLGKATYACALGRWESEAHWANFWYQSGSSRRELLIECLFGRSNAEVKAIKEAFSDKRYGDSLIKCMESELKKDKFRVAVLKVLEAKREEGVEIKMKQVEKDVHDLYKALTSKDGGETAMLSILVVRSDDHLRAVMQEYEHTYQQNFAREMIKRSQNLVGETLAHILNGVLNRPVRDALLLHQAIAETSKDRAELIISRLVRFHWEPKHLTRVKQEYAKRYRVPLEHDIEDGTKGDFSAFCVALCQGAVR